MKLNFLISLFLIINTTKSIAQETEQVLNDEKTTIAAPEPEFKPFYSLRIEALGGGSKLRYQNKSTGVIYNDDSKKLLFYNLRLVYHTSDDFRWYAGVNIEDVAFKNLKLENEMSFNPHLGLGWSATKNLALALEISLYQHMEMNNLQEVFRRADPAVRFAWDYTLTNWEKEKSRWGIGQNYLITIPLKNETSDPLDKNDYADFDIATHVYYRKSYDYYSIEFSLQHNFRGFENVYYKMEMNDLSIGTRFSIPF